jgi:hypothetical protein
LCKEASDRQENQTHAEPKGNPPGPVAHVHKHLHVVEVHDADSADHAVSCHVILLTFLVHIALRKVKDKEDTEATDERVDVVEEDPENKTLAVTHFPRELVVLGQRNG